jgi:intraflagellar transport protein 46
MRPIRSGRYDPAHYLYLSVPEEVRDLFQYILQYQSIEKELDVTLKCFIPEYIPCIGDPDLMIKVRSIRLL